jgi:hypothetical protein
MPSVFDKLLSLLPAGPALILEGLGASVSFVRFGAQRVESVPCYVCRRRTLPGQALELPKVSRLSGEKGAVRAAFGLPAAGIRVGG